MKRRARQRQSQVRWLPDQSVFTQTHLLQFAAPNTITQTTSQELLYNAGGTPDALFPGSQAFARDAVVNRAMILDHIVGKVSWNVEGSYQGNADASGIWRYAIRSAIMIIPKVTNATGTADNVTGFAGVTTENLDPGATYPQTLFGSFVQEGVRFLWKRNWLLSIDWEAGANATGTLVSNEDACPPGPYVDIKPKRILRENEALIVCMQAQTLAGPGAGGSSGLYWGSDLRIAAHPTMRRR